MGAGEIIQAIIENSIAFGSLLIAIASWLESRRNRSEPQLIVRIDWNTVSMTMSKSDQAETEQEDPALDTPDELGEVDHSDISP
ncbi:MAG TPA: hypothetical protein DGT23_07860 [Micromonosporaceae bacterium]|nr:hypothetical protein [Micromonosporaceae bacterium]